MGWTATRAESFVVDTHARDMATKAKMAFDRAGRCCGLRCETIAAYGAYTNIAAPVIFAALYLILMTGPYRTPAAHVTVTGVFTNHDAG